MIDTNHMGELVLVCVEHFLESSQIDSSLLVERDVLVSDSKSATYGSHAEAICAVLEY